MNLEDEILERKKVSWEEENLGADWWCVVKRTELEKLCAIAKAVREFCSDRTNDLTTTRNLNISLIEFTRLKDKNFGRK